VDLKIRSQVVTVPPASYMMRMEMNDYAMACHRDACSKCFNMVTEWETCHTEPVDRDNDPCCYGHDFFYQRVQVARDWSVRESVELFPGTILRRDTIECNRVTGYPALVQRCHALGQRMNASMPWTCQYESGGEVEVSLRCGAYPRDTVVHLLMTADEASREFRAESATGAKRDRIEFQLP